MTSHTFRKTVASRLDDAGFSIRHIADQLGHARPSTTLDHYLGRRAVTTADHAAALCRPRRAAISGSLLVRLWFVSGSPQRARRTKPQVTWAPWDSNPQPAG